MAYHPPADTKVCKRCGIEKPGSEFALEPRNADGLRGRCRECAAIVRAESLAKEQTGVLEVADA